MPHVKQLFLGLAALGLLLSGGAAWAEEPKSEPAKSEAETKAEAAKVEAAWVKTWDAAKAKAKLEKKDLLIDFTGSDWCGPCMKLHEEVFTQVEFVDAATKDYVLVYLDYPKGEEHTKLVVDMAANERLRELYGVNSFPTIILANADGLPYVRTGGYRPGGPAAFLKTLEEFKPNHTAFLAFQAKGKQDAAAFEAGFALLVEGEFLGFPDYAWSLDRAEKQDADGSKGFKRAVEAERVRQRSRVEALALRKVLQNGTPAAPPWEEIQKFLLASKDLSGNMLAQWSIQTADWLFSQKRFEEAKVLYKLPLRDPDIAANPRAQEFIAGKVKEADDAANPKPAEPEEPKPDAPKPETPKPGATPK